MSQMLFSELYKIMVNKVTFVGFSGVIPASHLPLASINSFSQFIKHHENYYIKL